MIIDSIQLKFPIIFCLLACMACGGRKPAEQINELAQKIGRTSMVEDYPKVPQEEILLDMPASQVYFQLQQRYTNHLNALKAATTRDEVRLLVLVMTPEVGKYATQANTYGIPYILQICTNAKVDVQNITPAIAEWSSSDDGINTPMYGNWSKQGTSFAAGQIANILAEYSGYRSPTTYGSAQRPATFGDATKDNTGIDNVNDLPHGGDKTPYRLHLSKQGLRMDNELSFPKTRQRIVFMGDSRIFNPFLDDEYTITYRLQARFPGIEIVNAGNISCCMDDYATLYEEKLRYAEPDVLVVCTNGGDILDEYFTHRNRFSRNKKCYKPTEAEVNFYKKTYKK
ncbi:hypothetical protein GCM10023093_08490 [Nemorincola caseinilytica]|uniref:Uncharacterized protein n=2 Tax=Nemorincola caseinilytica TaxID=2054315 RepID=A0ABP8NAL0_9BACT